MTASAGVRVEKLRSGLVGLLALVFVLVGLGAPSRALADPDCGVAAETAEAGLARLERDSASVRAAPAPADPLALGSAAPILEPTVAGRALALADGIALLRTQDVRGSLGPRGPPR